MASGVVTRSLLHHLSDDERRVMLTDVVRALDDTATITDVQLVISLWEASPDVEARSSLIQYANNALVQGRFEIVNAICEADASLREQLLQNTVDSLLEVSDFAFVHDQNAFFAVEPAIPAMLDPSHIKLEGILSSTTINGYWRFTRDQLARITSSESKSRLLHSALMHLGASDQSISSAARRTLFTMMTQDGTCLEQTFPLWSTIEVLATAQSDAYYCNLGYSLWLLATTLRSSRLTTHHTNAYWGLLQEGLLKGDTERRKQCLGILRQSTQAMDCQPEGGEFVMVCNVGRLSDFLLPGLDNAGLYYERYLTVFETIVLGRFVNQIIACEPDLRFLTSKESPLDQKWVYVLLAAALQGGNHKIIGEWIMRDGLEPRPSADFILFFQDFFLPWALSGTLFATSLQKQHGEQTCVHGDKLAKYITFAVEQAFSTGGLYRELIDVIVAALANKVSNSFGYAAVYVLEGLSRAIYKYPTLTLTTQHTEAIERLATWDDLPEVARDYVKIRCWKLLADRIARHRVDNENDKDEAVKRWEGFISTLPKHRLVGEPIASWGSTRLSKRDQMEQETMRKCHELRETLCNNDRPQPTAAVLETDLLDIWSDVEYLEYPKKLLMTIVDLVLHPIVIRVANTCESLTAAVRQVVGNLQELTKNRIYIFSPMVLSLVVAVFECNETIELLSVQDLVLHYINTLPTATIDLQLEDATATLLQNVGPEFAPFGYAHYFGDRMAVGVAALTDFISRIGSTHPQLVKSIFFSILQRWTRQKTPVPSVSPWKTALSLQILLLCCEQIAPALSVDEQNSVLKDLHYNISIEPLPHLRYVFTWIAIRIYIIRPELQATVLQDLTSKDHHSNPKYVAALMKMAVILSKTSHATESFVEALAVSFVPLAASSKVVIRHESQWQIPQLMDHARLQGWRRITSNPAVDAIDAYIRSLDNFANPPRERQLDRFDPITDHTLTNLVEGSWYNLDYFEQPLCTRKDLLHVEDVYHQSNLATLPPRCISLGEELPSVKPVDAHDAPPPIAAQEVVLAPSRAHESRALQTKGTAYLAATQSLAQEQGQRVRGRDIIVVASLVDNPYNLGGLSRVSEIFGAKEMHLQNQNVTSNRDFIGVAVSSHLHLPISQLSASAVSGFVADRRDAGYTIVGMEQTNRSMLLGSEACHLPEKMVLVIGSEKEGIPALILAECDLLVEIPQQGVTRSLNVQTATAIVLFEYARQHG